MPRVMFAVAGMIVAANAVAQDNCVLQIATVTNADAVVERGAVTANIVTDYRGVKKCVVSFRARVGSDWHVTGGEWQWDGVSPPETACALAVKEGEKALVETIAPVALRSEQRMLCNDSESLRTLPLSEIGQRGNLDQFRVHPEYPNVFYHNGTECRWTLDTVFERSKVKTYQGIICKMAGNQWVLVDRF